MKWCLRPMSIKRTKYLMMWPRKSMCGTPIVVPILILLLYRYILVSFTHILYVSISIDITKTNINNLSVYLWYTFKYFHVYITIFNKASNQKVLHRYSNVPCSMQHQYINIHHISALSNILDTFKNLL